MDRKNSRSGISHAPASGATPCSAVLGDGHLRAFTSHSAPNPVSGHHCLIGPEFGADKRLL
jgi:hypothetical protein